MLEQPLADRARFGDETCSGDEHLRPEVEFLLSGEQALDKMDQPVFEIAAGLLSTHIPELVAGELIGHYTILSFLGVGGMGEVYLAEDTNSSKLTRNKCSFRSKRSYRLKSRPCGENSNLQPILADRTTAPRAWTSNWFCLILDRGQDRCSDRNCGESLGFHRNSPFILFTGCGMRSPSTSVRVVSSSSFT